MAGCAAGSKKVNEDGMTVTKAGDFARWYQEVVVKSEMIEYYDVSGASSPTTPPSWATFEHSLLVAMCRSESRSCGCRIVQ